MSGCLRDHPCPGLFCNDDTRCKVKRALSPPPPPHPPPSYSCVTDAKCFAVSAGGILNYHPRWYSRGYQLCQFNEIRECFNVWRNWIELRIFALIGYVVFIIVLCSFASFVSVMFKNWFDSLRGLDFNFRCIVVGFRDVFWMIEMIRFIPLFNVIILQ